VPREEVEPSQGFNEAAADAAEFCDGSMRFSRPTDCFNEAAADAAEFYHLSQARVCSGSSLQ